MKSNVCATRVPVNSQPFPQGLIYTGIFCAARRLEVGITALSLGERVARVRRFYMPERARRGVSSDAQGDCSVRLGLRLMFCLT